ncbi:S-layer homology domain-containing protein [Niameybacter massiliensis]|uniref:S-layer homology domain-containing protein n=1 Tax=Holtiella tumoricola TaxID=3018743 RepID=A0AA42DMR7_9FIRM|nr:S-layer homology domain-containing protein [Holtiella tumoricola]MDA3731819.1 S-layer homology domain-containing protein [Holtiella tumoricola]
MNRANTRFARKALACYLSLCMFFMTLFTGVMEVSALSVVNDQDVQQEMIQLYSGQSTTTPGAIEITTPGSIQLTTSGALQLMMGGTTYYVSNAGDDNNDGTTPQTPWATVEKVNEQVFLPGDQILFKAGDVWAPSNEGYAPEINGGWPQWQNEEGVATAFLKPKGSGTEQNPIIIGKYGTESYNERPLFNGLGKVNFTIHIKNMNHIIVEDLEVTNQHPEAVDNQNHTRVLRGIYIENHGIEGNTMRNITVQDCFVRDINAHYHHRFNNEGGIIIRSTKQGPYNFDGVYIRNNTIHNVDYGGIFFRNDNQNRGAIGAGIGPWIGSPNIVIENNSLDQIGGDGIVVSTGIGTVIQYNVVKDSHLKCPAPCAAIWNINSDDTLLQYNEAYLTRQDTDGQAYDADGGCNRTIYQYNYSHDNEGGFMLLCQWGGGDNRNGVIRYNISQNDLSKVIHFAGATNFKIYNNTFYAGPGNNTEMTRSTGDSAEFNNNIFYNDGTNFSFANGSGHRYNNNLYYGIDESKLPNDPNKMVVDPMLYAPGTGGVLYPLTIESAYDNRAMTWESLVNEKLKGYKLMEGSPAIDAGIEVDLSTNQVVPATKDFFGNSLGNGRPDMGAHEFSNDAPAAIQEGTSWKFSEGYSIVSGENHWSYLLFSENNTPLITVFDTPNSNVSGVSSSWRGTQWIFKKSGGANPHEGHYPDEVVPVDDTVAYIAKDKMSLPVKGYQPHTMYNNGPTNMTPLAQHDKIGYGFLVPQAGVYNISGSARKDQIGGDGVELSIQLSNGTEILAPVTLEANDTTKGITHDITLDLNKGDVIYFIAGSRENNSADVITWDPIVTYIGEGIRKPEIPEGSYFIDDRQTHQIIYTDMTPQTHLSELLGMNKTTHIAQENGQGTAELEFMGSAIQVISQKAPLNGEMEIILYQDEQEMDRVSVSAQSDHTEPYFIAYDKQDLEYGKYRLVVANKGPQMVIDGFIIDTCNQDGTSNLCSIDLSSNLDYVEITLEDERGYVLQKPYKVLRNSKVTVNASLTNNAYTLVGFNINGTFKGPESFTTQINEDTYIQAILAEKNNGTLLDLRNAKVETNNRHGELKFAPEKAFDQIEDDSHAYAPSYTNTFPLNGKPAPYLIVELPSKTQVTQTTLINKGMSEFRVKSYKVEFSTDGIHFNNEQLVENMAALNESTIMLDEPLSATHLKITVLEDDDNRNNFVLCEFKVYGMTSIDKHALSQAIIEAQQVDLTDVATPIANEFKGLIALAKLYEASENVTQEVVDQMVETLRSKQTLLKGNGVYLSIECSLLGEQYSVEPQLVAIPESVDLKALGSATLKELLTSTFQNTAFNADGKLIALNHIRPTSWVISINNDRTNSQPDTRKVMIHGNDVIRISYSNKADGSDILADVRNKDALIKQIGLVNTYQKEQLKFNPDLLEAYNDAVSLFQSLTATQQTINAAADKLEKINTYATEAEIQSIRDKIIQAQAYDPTLYTEESYNILVVAVREGQKVLGKNQVTKFDVEQTIKKINQGISGLVLIGNLEATQEEIKSLEDKLKEAKTYHEDLYTVESYNILEGMIEKIERLLNEEAITKSQVQQGIRNLNEAIEGLIPREEVEATPEEIQTLSATLVQAKSYNKALYTTQSYKNLEIAMDKANKILAQNKITKLEVEQGIQHLKKAIAELVRLSTDGGGSSGGSSSGSGSGGGVSHEKEPEQPNYKETITIDGVEVDKEKIIVFKDQELISNYAKHAVNLATALGLIHGDEGYFRPQQAITRAEFVKMIIALLGLDITQPYTNVFEDVTSTDWYANYLSVAYEEGILIGDSGYAYPNAPITRQEMAVILIRALKLEQVKGNEYINDFEHISEYAKEAVQTAYYHELIQGMNGNFKPHDTANREMAVTVVVRAYKAFLHQQ